MAGYPPEETLKLFVLNRVRQKFFSHLQYTFISKVIHRTITFSVDMLKLNIEFKHIGSDKHNKIHREPMTTIVIQQSCNGCQAITLNNKIGKFKVLKMFNSFSNRK